MLYGISNKIIISQCVMLSLLLSISTILSAEESLNPWAPSWGMSTSNKPSKVESSSADLSNSVPLQTQSRWRFVTPEFLDSLKQQQMQLQSMGGQLTEQVRTNQRRMAPSRSCTGQSSTVSRAQLNSDVEAMTPKGIYFGRTEMPSWPNMSSPAGSFRMNDNLVYDTPTVSPWGKGADVLYRGESFPKAAPGALPPTLGGQFPGMSGARSWAPKEALGGLLPMPVSAAGINKYQVNKFDDAKNFTERKSKNRVVNNVFNPFTFLPGDSLH